MFYDTLVIEQRARDTQREMILEAQRHNTWIKVRNALRELAKSETR